MGISWSPLCVLKGVKPPVEFGEKKKSKAFGARSGEEESPGGAVNDNDPWRLQE